MAKSVFIMLLLLFFIAMISFVATTTTTTTTTVMAADAQYNPTGYGQGSLKSYQCGGECSRRCGRTQYKKPCLFFCNKCCSKCLCVPPGYYGNKQLCPCYNNWKTKRGGPKCP
ncbi:gibberellin-regulated protein 6-like [Impatiens glandulifera]|uniref:gibberellin-regulated protein 6-like n=1 Tax=Impatiens glandulifera TaxID=253017 RepID=UPI001FB0EF94|nr:gibberellin-regulated protein 6-like [Impatiens glandulifera]